MRHIILSLVILTCWLASAQTQTPPPLPPMNADHVFLVPLNFTDDAAARAAWKAMPGTAEVSVCDIGENQRALRMPCNFNATKIERASWDCAVNLDLAACQGIQLKFFCRDASPVSHFSIYFQSGDGWYAGSFAPKESSAWNTIRVEKSGMRSEGTPVGWGKIQAIRISAWRGSDTSTEFYIADLGLLGGDEPIALISGDSVVKQHPDEAEAVGTYTEAVGQVLKDLGVPYVVISDLDVTPERLKGKKLLILPHNPYMPENVSDRLISFLNGGGKLIVFYVMPEKLRPVAGIDGGRHIHPEKAGHFASMHFSDGVLQGAPHIVMQSSWNISEATSVEGRSRVAAAWYDEQGNATGDAAVVVSPNCIQMTHVLLASEPANKRRMLLAMVGHFMPEIWQQAAHTCVEHIGQFGPFKDAVEAQRALNSDKAAGERNIALQFYVNGKYPEALDAAAQADASFLNAYCASLKPEPGEHRALWCHSAFGVHGMDWDAAIKTAADNGFTDILPNMLWGGTAYYQSSVLPVAPQISDKGDQIVQCLAACRKYGLKCHVWKVSWNTGGNATKEFIEKMNAAGRTQVAFDGKPENTWLCPSHPDNQKLEIDAMVEVATKYDVDGIHFDYIRYPGPDSCFCPGCRKRFEASLGEPVKNWPGDTRSDELLRRKWLDFRRENITKVVAAVSQAARKARPAIQISAAVFSNWALDRDGVGQDWKLWCEKGYLDFVCPMDYTPENSQFENMVKQQTGWAGKVPVYPGIGLSCWTPTGDICKLIEQIQITRRLKTGGFTVFNYGADEAREILPLCGKGLTRKP